MFHCVCICFIQADHVDNDIFQDYTTDVPKPDPKIFGFGVPKPKKRAEYLSDGDFPSLTMADRHFDDVVMEGAHDYSKMSSLHGSGNDVSSRDKGKKKKRNWMPFSSPQPNDSHVPPCVRSAFNKKIERRQLKENKSKPDKSNKSSGFDSIVDQIDKYLMSSGENTIVELEENGEECIGEQLNTKVEHCAKALEPGATDNYPDHELSDKLDKSRSEMLSESLFSFHKDESRRNDISASVTNVDTDEAMNICESVQSHPNSQPREECYSDEIIDLVNDYSSHPTLSLLAENEPVNIKTQSAEILSSNVQENDVQMDPFSIGSSRWNMGGNFVIQLNGLPASCELMDLTDMIGSFGTIREVEKQCSGNVRAMRIR